MASENSRFDLMMRRDQRRALDELAAELGTTPSELLRMGATWVLAHRDFLLRGRPPAQTTGAAA